MTNKNLSDATAFHDELYAHRWLVIITIMLVAVLEVLDSTIVNVALPAMEASLSTNQDQITWVLTSYVVSSAIMLPLTGFLTRRIGQKQLLLINISGFMISSALCGIATSLPEIIFFRVLQGVFGASLIPLSQSILRATFPLNEQPKAMSIWGIGIMASPVLGPTLGGFITQHASWRWIFYINIPICLIAFTMTLFIIPKTKPMKQKIDYFGLFLMVVGVACLQIFLDKGNSDGWFSSNFILLLFVISGFCLIYFIIRSLFTTHPVIRLSIFRDRNFALACIIMACFAGSMFALITFEPIMLESLFNYPAETAGIVMAPLGLASAVIMVFQAKLMKVINVKFILATGFLLCSYGALRMSQIDLNASGSYFVIANAIMGAGMGSLMVPLSTYSLASLPKERITEGAGLFSYSRQLGTSIGISLLSSLISHLAQVNWQSLSRYINHFNSNLHHWFNQQGIPFLSNVGLGRLNSIINQQANLIAFVDTFQTISLIFLLLIPLVLAMRTIDLNH